MDLFFTKHFVVKLFIYLIAFTTITRLSLYCRNKTAVAYVRKSMCVCVCVSEVA